MINNINSTPMNMRLHIGIFGNTNAGKSSIFNKLTSQNIAIVSDIKGTTTDPVYKAMELHPIGPVVFIDTAGIDDTAPLSDERIQKSREILNSIDLGLIVTTANSNLTFEKELIGKLKKQNSKCIIVINKTDEIPVSDEFLDKIKQLGPPYVTTSVKNDSGFSELRAAIINNADINDDTIRIPGVSENDFVLLVMPQDIAAPKGRLILPQVQITRTLLDLKAVVISATLDTFYQSYDKFKDMLSLVICDSQIFKKVDEYIDKDTPLTSFSILISSQKGYMDIFRKSAGQIDKLADGDSILICESCTHNPLEDDIARVKIPALLKKYTGKILNIDVITGKHLPTGIEKYSLVIHCAGCMFTKREMMGRIAFLTEKNIPVTNFGIALAKLSGILNRIKF